MKKEEEFAETVVNAILDELQGRDIGQEFHSINQEIYQSLVDVVNDLLDISGRR